MRSRSADEASVVEEAMRRLVTVDLTRVPAGPALFEALARRPGVAEQDEYTLLETLAAQERAIAALHAAQVEVLAEFGRRRRGQYDDGSDEAPAAPRQRKDFAADELTARLRWTTWTAAHRLDEAERLSTCLPRTWTALDAGLLDYARVRRIVTATRMLSEDQAAAVDAAVADRAQGLTTGQLDELLATEVTAVDAQAAERRAARATAARSVRVAPQPDGQAQLLAEGPAADVLTVIRALTAAAGQPRAGDDRGIDARRFDALRDWARAALSGAGSGPRATADGSSGAWRPSVLLTVGLGTVLRLDDEPGHLHGYGPVPAHIARQITAEGTLRRVLTDPVTGVVVGVDGHTYPGGLRADPPDDPPPDDGSPPGAPPPDDDPPGDSPPRDDRPRAAASDCEPRRSARCAVAAAGGGSYRPPRALDRFVRFRDGTCTAIGCRRRAEACDLDHIVPHPRGPTCGCNLHPLCRRHHRMKHESGATVIRKAAGTTIWRMPTGHTYARALRPALPRPEVRLRTPAPQGAQAPACPSPPQWDSAAAGAADLAAAVEGPAPVPAWPSGPYAGPPPF